MADNSSKTGFKTTTMDRIEKTVSPMFLIVTVCYQDGLGDYPPVLAPNRAIATKVFYKQVIDIIDEIASDMFDDFAADYEIDADNARGYDALFESQNINNFMEWLDMQDGIELFDSDHFLIDTAYINEKYLACEPTSPNDFEQYEVVVYDSATIKYAQRKQADDE